MDNYSLSNSKLSMSMPLLLMLMLLLLFLAGCMIGGVRIKEDCIYGNCQEGIGIKRHSSGLSVGQWSDGKLHGKGSKHNDFRDDRYYGNWKMGKMHGAGALFLDKGIITGEWRNGLPSVEMTYIGKDGTFTGRLESDRGFNRPYLFPAEGELIWPSSNKYRGEFGCLGQVHCGVPQGSGEFENNSGKIIRGQFTTKFGGNIFFPSVLKGEVVSVDGIRKYTLDIMDRGSPITFKFREISDLETIKK